MATQTQHELIAYFLGVSIGLIMPRMSMRTFGPADVVTMHFVFGIILLAGTLLYWWST